YTQPDDFAEQTNDILQAMDEVEASRQENLMVERSDIGSRVNRMEQVGQILDSLRINTESARSAIQDADVFESAANFSSLQTALEALLTSTAQINRLSLLDYI